MRRKAPDVVRAQQVLALHWIQANLPSAAAVLDVGCGKGWFLALLEKHGFAAIGTEVAETTAITLRSKGFRVHAGEIAEYPREWPHPDAITLFDVLEHLPDPALFLASLKRNFPAAPLIACVPNPERWNLRVGWRERWDYPPNHLFRFTKDGLRRALLKAGYERLHFMFPKIGSQDIFLQILDGLLQLVERKLWRGALPTSVKPTHRAQIISRIARHSQMLVWAYDLSRWVSSAVLWPIATLLNWQRWQAHAMVVVALPPTSITRDRSIDGEGL
jgi:SAM-dependent methyltransferase